MPIYAYKCESCGHALDVLQKMSDAPLTACHACGAPALKKQLTAAGFQLKGSGWYATDFKGGAPAADKSAEGISADSDANTDTKTDTNSDAKSDVKADSKADAKSDSKADAKTETKAAAKTETNTSSKPASRTPSATPAPSAGGSTGTPSASR